MFCFCWDNTHCLLYHQFMNIWLISIFLNFYWFFVDFTSFILITLISLSPLIHFLPLQPFTQIKTKFKRKAKNQTKTEQKQQKKKNLVMEAKVWTLAHSIHLYLQVFIFLALDFWVLLDTGFLLDILLLSCVLEVLMFCIYRFIAFTCSSNS